jgi:mannose-1-phosphate guanylyltransferase
MLADMKKDLRKPTVRTTRKRTRARTKLHRYAVIMAGGSGTRLWPMSRRSKPKQFHSILGERSLFQEMYSLLRKDFGADHIFVQIPAEFLSLVQTQIPTIAKSQILIEPEARDTAPAFAFAAASIRMRDPAAFVGFYYSDHFIQSDRAFHRAVQEGFGAAEKCPDHLVLVGVRPLYAHTGLGYIEYGKRSKTRSGAAYQVESFVEKPDLRRAKRFLVSNRYLWNTGYKVARASYILDFMSRSNKTYDKRLPALEDALRSKNRTKIRSVFHTLPRQSFEYAVTEKGHDLLVVVSDMIWSDVGDWDAIHEALLKKGDVSVKTVGRAVDHGSRNTLLISNHRPVIGIGLKDIVIVETRDGVLVMSKHKSKEMKHALEKLRARHPESL